MLNWLASIDFPTVVLRGFQPNDVPIEEALGLSRDLAELKVDSAVYWRDGDRRLIAINAAART